MSINVRFMVAFVRTRIRSLFFYWWWFKAARIYGNDIHPTVRLSRTTMLDKTNPKGVHVGEYSYFASGVIVLAHDMCRKLRTSTHIGNKCFIGANAIILPGINIGDEVIIGSGSVVTRDVPSNCIVAGNPAKIIKQGIHTLNYGILIRNEESTSISPNPKK